MKSLGVRLIALAGLGLIGFVIWHVAERVSPWRHLQQVPRAESEAGNLAPRTDLGALPGDRGVSTMIETQAVTSSSKLPESIRLLLARPEHQRPRMREVEMFDAAAEDELIRHYRAIPSLGDKQHILRMLAYRGGEKSVKLFIRALTEEYTGKKLSRAEEGVMCYLPELMGLLARRCESAKHFLREASDPRFWAGRIPWEWDLGPADSILAGAALNGLALTGTEEVRELLFLYRSRVDHVVRWNLEGAVVDAVYRHRLVTEHGIEYVMDEILYYAGDMRHLMNWWTTDEGRSWYEWYVEIGRQRASATPTKFSP